MATAAFFLLLAIWMQELSLIGIRAASLIGVALLAASAWRLWDVHRAGQAVGNPGAALAALRRSARTRGVKHVDVRTVRLVR
jgi:hypothetical protein